MTVAPTVAEKQYGHADTNEHYACFFTEVHQYLTRFFGFQMTWAEYKIACVNAGALRNDFAILDRQKMADAANCGAIRACDSTVSIQQKIDSILAQGKFAIVSLNGGEHYESIVARRQDGNYDVTDPGYQNDAQADGTTLEFFHLNATGQKIYSADSKGGRRAPTHVYWFEK